MESLETFMSSNENFNNTKTIGTLLPNIKTLNTMNIKEEAIGSNKLRMSNGEISTKGMFHDRRMIIIYKSGQKNIKETSKKV